MKESLLVLAKRIYKVACILLIIALAILYRLTRNNYSEVFTFIKPEQYKPTACGPISPEKLDYNFYSNLQNTLRYHNLSVLTSYQFGTAVCFVTGITPENNVEFFLQPRLISYGPSAIQLVNHSLCNRTWLTMRPTELEFQHTRGKQKISNPALAAEYYTAFLILNGTFVCQ
jgi:hypothetical protein